MVGTLLLRKSKIIRALKPGYNKFCRMTHFWRKEPNFLILGAQKAGTTSLLEYMCEHPSLERARAKEIHFFDENYDKGIKWYKSFFKLKLNKRLTGEASPYYLFHPAVAQRIKHHYDGLKLIILLREPVERAISHYFHSVKNGFENLPILEALQQEEKRLSSDFQKIKNEHYSLGWQYKEQSYIQRGLYLQQIERYENFFPKESILLINSSEFFENPASVMQKVFVFMGVDKNFKPQDLRAKNSGSYKDVNEDVIHFLQTKFEQSNKGLASKYGIKFDSEQ